MKPNTKQKLIFSELRNIVWTWENSNDINSGSHWNMIDEYQDDLIDSGITENVAKEICNKMGEILTLIRLERR